MAQWWERSPLTNVARFQIPASTPYLGWVCSWFAPRGFSPDTPVFSSPQKPTFPNSSSTMSQVDEEPLCGCATFKSLFIYLFYSNSADWANHVLSQSTALLFLLFFLVFSIIFSLFAYFCFCFFSSFFFFPFIRSKWQIYIMIKITDGSLPVELSSWPIKAKANGT